VNEVSEDNLKLGFKFESVISEEIKFEGKDIAEEFCEDEEGNTWLKVGRKKGNDIVLSHSAISSNHATFRPEGTVEDTSSAGTYIHVRSNTDFDKGF